MDKSLSFKQSGTQGNKQHETGIPKIHSSFNMASLEQKQI